jgi:hypothetical protein
MKQRSFAELMAGVVAYVSLTGFAALARDPQPPRHLPDERWTLPTKRRRRRVAEDSCRHCKGTGVCDSCAPSWCRVCRGTGLQPRDATVMARLNQLWSGRA